MRHPYTDHDTCVTRLVEWRRTNGRIIVAFDFDNTVYDYHSRGHDYSDVVVLLREARDVGAFLIVFTGNGDTEFVRSYLEREGIPYDVINEQASFLTTTARKIYYNLLLDDAAGLASACEHLRAYIDIVKTKP
jgi:hydroxymethylpyrimidine pyrophosphatase-like HAD family hydrolase